MLSIKVALFVTCFNDTLFPGTGRAVVRVLERLGHQVEFPVAQTCCGQMHLNTGYPRDAARLARRFVGAFEGFDAVVSPSASCVAMVRENYSQFGVGALPVYEFTEFLVDVAGVVDVGARFAHRVTYHPTCHGLRMLGLADRPTMLLSAVRELELVELPGATECCGFGGTFAVKNADVSVAMGRDKLAKVAATGAEVLAAADNSCLLHLGGMLRKDRSGIRVAHIAEILAAQ